MVKVLHAANLPQVAMVRHTARTPQVANSHWKRKMMVEQASQEAKKVSTCLLILSKVCQTSEPQMFYLVFPEPQKGQHREVLKASSLHLL